MISLGNAPCNTTSDMILIIRLQGDWSSTLAYDFLFNWNPFHSFLNRFLSSLFYDVLPSVYLVFLFSFSMSFIIKSPFGYTPLLFFQCMPNLLPFYFIIRLLVNDLLQEDNKPLNSGSAIQEFEAKSYDWQLINKCNLMERGEPKDVEN